MLPYTGQSSEITIGWSDNIFNNTEPVNCGPITGCNLFQDDCKTELDQTQKTYIFIN